MLLWLLEGNRRARCFYEAFGFRCMNRCQHDLIGSASVREVLYSYIFNIKQKG